MREPTFDSEDLAVAEKYMRQQRAIKGVDPSWEECSEFALARKGLSRYAKSGVEQVNNSDDVPPIIGQTVLERLGVKLTPSDPYCREIHEINGGMRSFHPDEINAIRTYAAKHSMTLEEAARSIGLTGVQLAAPKGTP
jgi:hypothetical protein